MRFAVHFADNEEHAAKRQQFMQDHLEFLLRHKTSILAAGPLFDAATGTGAGGQWVVEAADEAEVTALVREDPFFPTGLRKEIKIFEWKPVFDSGEVRV
jgi:uncharacterized protein YciI